jgi:hypothetical protein
MRSTGGWIVETIAWKIIQLIRQTSKDAVYYSLIVGPTDWCDKRSNYWQKIISTHFAVL